MCKQQGNCGLPCIAADIMHQSTSQMSCTFEQLVLSMLTPMCCSELLS